MPSGGEERALKTARHPGTSSALPLSLALLLPTVYVVAAPVLDFIFTWVFAVALMTRGGGTPQCVAFQAPVPPCPLHPVWGSYVPPLPTNAESLLVMAGSGTCNVER